MQEPQSRMKLDYSLIIGVGSFIIALITLYNDWSANKVKSIEYRVVANQALNDIETSLNNRLQMTFDGQPVSNLFFVVVEIANVGNEEILVDDYESPIKFTYGRNATVLNVEQISATPNDITTSITYTGNTTLLSPVLLNEDDVIKFGILVSNSEGMPIASCRIQGIKNCNMVEQIGNRQKLGIPYDTIALMAITIFFTAYRNVMYRKESKKNHMSRMINEDILGKWKIHSSSSHNTSREGKCEISYDSDNELTMSGSLFENGNVVGTWDSTLLKVKGSNMDLIYTLSSARDGHQKCYCHINIESKESMSGVWYLIGQNTFSGSVKFIRSSQ